MPNPHRSTASVKAPAAAKRAVFVDSGGWIALFSLRDANHAVAQQLFEAAVTGAIPLLTTNLVAAEVQRFLLFRVGLSAAARALDVIDGKAGLHMHFATESDHRQARDWIGSLSDQKISYTDAVSFAVMDSQGCRGFIGFDRDFDIAGFVRWRG